MEPEMLSPNQKCIFPNACTIPPTLPKGMDKEAFWGRPYEILDEMGQGFLTILSGGIVEARPPYAFSLRSIPCRMLLYTRQGNGLFKSGNREYLLEEHTLLYHRCDLSQEWKLEISKSDIWEYMVFFLSDSGIGAYEKLCPDVRTMLIHADPYGRISLCFNKLIAGAGNASLCDKLTDNMLLHQILCELWNEALALTTEVKNCPLYLMEIKNSMDTFFMDDFNLQELEERYHVSKYRICKEFAEAFSIPPMKYLNTKRLEAAAHLLLSTDRKIHEISLDVGFETTNHFINLFKRELGVTPQAYRDANA